MPEDLTVVELVELRMWRLVERNELLEVLDMGLGLRVELLVQYGVLLP